MKLTNLIRAAFVIGVMNDVPSKADNSEAIRKLVVDDMVQRLPTNVRKVWNNTSTRHFLKTDFNSYGGISVNYPAAQQSNRWNKPALTPAIQAQVTTLQEETTQDLITRNALLTKIKAAAYGCTTRKQLVELLPEFEKYLPEDSAKATRTNLPAVANLLSEFTKAGWPKNKQAVAD